MELWSDLPAYLNLSKYQISTLGRIQNKQTNNILKPSVKEGYHRLGLVHDNSKRRPYYMHSLVALTFISNPENKLTVNHKNGIRNDNSVSNLEWATAQEQNAHKSINPIRPTRKVRQYGRDGVLIKIWDSVTDVKKKFPNFNRYISGTSEHSEYIFQYDDMFLLPGEIFIQTTVEAEVISVSNYGRIYKNNRWGIHLGTLTEEGYRRVFLGKSNCYVHRLVGIIFIEKPEHLKDISYDDLLINHKDGNKSNNRTDNLEWCTNSENVKHACYTLNHTNSRSVVQYDLNGSKINEFTSSAEAGRSIGALSGSNIIQCCRGKINTACGYIWKYKDELV